MEGNLKQVKVDNWGVFFLQRLQQLYAKGDYCDLTLLFTNNERIKVHRLVLNACTEYFKLLEKLPGQATGAYLHMPSNMHPDVVLPIINFMYTGRLEFRAEVTEELYTTAQHMNMMVLTKLLDVQAQAPASAAPGGKLALPSLRKPDSTLMQHLGHTVKRNVVARSPDVDFPETLPGRKLPIWKRRNTPLQSSSHIDSSLLSAEKRKNFKPRPTRFEWPENGMLQPVPFTSSFDDLSYETMPIVRAPEAHKCPGNAFSSMVSTPSRTTSFEDIQRSASNSLKRPLDSSSLNEKNSSKTRVLDLQAVKEYVQEHQLRKDLLNTEEDGEDVDDDLAVADLDDDEDDDDEEVRTVTVSSMPEEIIIPTSSENLMTTTLMPQKSILKVPVLHEESISPSKKVRFSIDSVSAEKENTVEENTAVQEVELHEALESEQKEAPMSRSTSTAMTTLTNTGNISNHARIITEVLKKYPNLVKKNKNIKLKIMHRGPAPASTKAVDSDGNKSVLSKVSYVMLKSDVALAASKAKTDVKLDNAIPQNKVLTGAENTTGPWLCYTCGTHDEPMNFETYYLYRRHLQDVHMEKIDARICEHCGHRASKRNLLLYHLFTKHGVLPPRNCSFPSCEQCDYVALSESLLVKHRNSHLNSREFVCKVCKATFKSNGALQGHMQTNLHSVINKKLHECQYCQKPFVRNVNLKAHIRTCHKQEHKEELERGNGGGSLELGADESLTGDEGEVVEVPIMEAGESVNPGRVSLPPGVTLLAEGPNIHSSEAEALSNVASGIAASLGLAESAPNDQTVIVLDDTQEYILNTADVINDNISQVHNFVDNNTEVINDAVTEIQEYVEETAGAPARPDNQEFIVPDIMPGDEQVYPTVSYENSCNQAIVTQSFETPSSQTIVSRGYDPSQTIIVSQAYDSSNGQNMVRHVTEGEQITIPPPVSMASGEVTMILSDHDYVEDAVPREGMMIYITHPGDVDMGMIQHMTSGKGAQLLLASEPSGSEVQAALTQGPSGQLVQLEGGTIVRVIGTDEATGLQQPFLQENLDDDADVAVAGQSTNPVATDISGPLPESTIASDPHSTIPRPVVQMSELVKDWDDFDESEEECQVTNEMNRNSKVKTERVTTQLVKFLPQNLHNS